MEVRPMKSDSPKEWKDLTALTKGARMVVERVRILDTGIALEGPFELPPLAQLSMEDQVFVSAFVRSHGSIKEMERLFGVSYPTIKARLNRLSEALGLGIAVEANPGPSNLDILDRLARGEITAREAAEALRK
jgi:hypothetical protein